VVAPPSHSSAGERSGLLRREMEQLVVQAKKLGLGLDDVLNSVSSHWDSLEVNKDNEDNQPAFGKGGADR
jgi:GntR family transcriptional regulator